MKTELDHPRRVAPAARAIPFALAGVLALAMPAASPAQSLEGERALLNPAHRQSPASYVVAPPERVSGAAALLGRSGRRVTAAPVAPGAAPVSAERALLGGRSGGRQARSVRISRGG